MLATGKQKLKVSVLRQLNNLLMAGFTVYLKMIGKKSSVLRKILRLFIARFVELPELRIF